MQNDESGHKETGGVNSNLLTYTKKVIVVYGFLNFRCTEAIKFITGESKNRPEISEGAPDCTTKSCCLVTSLPES